MKLENSIALLATGDEILSGTIINSNGSYAAMQLFNSGITIALHVITSDLQHEIEEAIQYLLGQYKALLIIGGLGPTSDDRTRFALAAVLKQPLVFDDNSWQQIVERLTNLKAPVSETNKQQCLFPPTATILENKHGTANGCYIEHNQQFIFMLPGPPHEFIPLFNHEVLPRLLNTSLYQELFKCSWLILGIGEAAIAEKLDPLIDAHQLSIHYRVSSPYIEVKLQSHHAESFKTYKNKLQPILQPYLVSENNETASQQLLNYITESQQTFAISDCATYGLLQSKLLTPQTFLKIQLANGQIHKQDVIIEVSGLREYWAGQIEPNSTSITVRFLAPQEIIITKLLYLRGALTLNHAVELICWEILKVVRSKFQ